MKEKSSSGTAKQPDGVATTSGHGGSVISVSREEFVHLRTVIVAAGSGGGSGGKGGESGGGAGDGYIGVS